MPKVFIDTNAFLGFFAYASDDLAQLNTLIDEMKSGKVELLLTDQVREEFARNRENKIAETLRDFKAKLGIDKFPRLIQHYADYKGLQTTAKAYTDLKESILAALDKDIVSHKLPADITFSEILNVAKIIETSADVISAAQERMAIGKPPGKKGSLGDAINWELLLRSVSKSDLYIVTQDRDYLSPLGKERLNEYLADEWRKRCGGEVHLFETLRDLFKEIAPEIKLSPATTSASANTGSVIVTDPVVDDTEKAVAALEKSSSFARTHATISEMPDFWELSKGQIERLFRAGVENEQIAFIYGDSDVSHFFKQLYKIAKEQLPPDVAEKFAKLYGQK